MGQRRDIYILVMFQRGKGAIIRKQPTGLYLNITTAYHNLDYRAKSQNEGK